MTRETKMMTVVHCAKLNEELPAMARPPFPGELGQRLFDNISSMAFAQWQAQSTLIINHYGLNLADPRAQEFLMTQMESFFFDANHQAPSVGGAPSKGAK